MINKPIAEVFWNNVTQELKERRKTQKWLSIRLGLEPGYATKTKQKGNLPKAPTIENIAEILEVDYWVLFVDE